MDILEASMELALDFGKANREINNEKKNGAEVLPNCFGMTWNSFCPNAFDVPDRARRSGSA